MQSHRVPVQRVYIHCLCAGAARPLRAGPTALSKLALAGDQQVNADDDEYYEDDDDDGGDDDDGDEEDFQ